LKRSEPRTNVSSGGKTASFVPGSVSRPYSYGVGKHRGQPCPYSQHDQGQGRPRVKWDRSRKGNSVRLASREVGQGLASRHLCAYFFHGSAISGLSPFSRRPPCSVYQAVPRICKKYQRPSLSLASSLFALFAFSSLRYNVLRRYFLAICTFGTPRAFIYTNRPGWTAGR
jgi:hypothetical protein